MARTDAEAANLLDGCADERDQPFILGVTNVGVPSYRAVVLAILRRFSELGVEGLNGHLMFALSDAEYGAAFAWLDQAGLMAADRRHRELRSGSLPHPRCLAGRSASHDVRRGIR